VEFVELPREAHPFFVATQAHPEFLSRPTRPHPLFSGLVAAAIERSRAVPASSEAVAAGLRPAASARAGGRWDG
jgi:CTP synthase